MASKRRRKIPLPPQENVVGLMCEERSLDSESSDGESTASSLVDEIQVDFEAQPIVQRDFHGIRKLLQELFCKSCVDVSGLTEAILKQHNLGSTVKVCEEREYQSDSEGEDVSRSRDQISSRGVQEEEGAQDVLGVSTVLSLSKKEFPSVASVRNHLFTAANKFAPNGVSEQLVHLMARPDYNFALLIHERFVTIPSEIGPPLLQTLVKEVKELCGKGNSYTHYLVLTRSSLASRTDPFSSRRKRKRKAEKGCFNDAVKSRELLFDFPELEQIYTENVISFTYPVADGDSEVALQSNTNDDTGSCRTVFVVSKQQFFKTVHAMASCSGPK